MAFELVHHGGRTTVTGSCHEVRTDGGAFLVDCGLLQGDDAEGHSDGVDVRAIDFAVEAIRALVVTHVHIDHVGRIPWLLAAGFDGPIVCTEASAELLPLVMEDAVRIGITRDARLVEAMVARIASVTVAVPFDQWHALWEGGPRVRFRRAGHILGSAYVEVAIGARRGGTRVVFSGDLGAPWAPLLPAPRAPYRADTLVLESTYGDGLHPPRRERRRTLQRVLERALTDNGVVLIPAFSLGRTQELLYEIEGIVHAAGRRVAAGRDAGRTSRWEDLEIIVDSPLAARHTEVFRRLRHLWDAEARRRVESGRHPLSFEQLTTIDSHGDHMRAVAYLSERRRPAVVIAASGMCTGGRIVNWLKALVGDPTTDVVFVGYQAAGTPGRQILDYGPKGGYVVLDGRRYDIRAGVHRLGAYSAHADQAGLVRFATAIGRGPTSVRLVHGEGDAQRALAAKLRAALPGVVVD